MITIIPADNQQTAALAAREGAKPPVSALVLRTDEGDSGYALYRVSGDQAQLLCVRTQDALLQEGLVRAVLNAAANRQAYTAVCRDPDVFPLLLQLGFVQREDGCAIDIPDFFMRPCSGDQK